MRKERRRGERKGEKKVGNSGGTNFVLFTRMESCKEQREGTGEESAGSSDVTSWEVPGPPVLHAHSALPAYHMKSQSEVALVALQKAVAPSRPGHISPHDLLAKRVVELSAFLSERNDQV
ncbi:hypothetical protein R1sor_013305 [Riccia sorocarpa]|uniref:Uncharacterized protein n=1 Tax=Riccia sorocarpa TaxID=122646 RepID=A0ABD3HA87_9MARC